MTGAITGAGEPSYHGREVIRFRSTKGEHGYLSNFYRSPFVIAGKTWLHVEGRFQSQKVLGSPREEEIRLTASPMVAARMGRSREHPIRPNWTEIRLDVMREAVMAKFEQNADLRARLLSTGNAMLVEHSVRDRFYGDGGDGTGANWLGRILMETRDKLRRSDT